MFILTMPIQFKVGDSGSVKINGEHNHVTWLDQDTLRISHRDDRNIERMTESGDTRTFYCGDAVRMTSVTVFEDSDPEDVSLISWFDEVMKDVPSEFRQKAMLSVSAEHDGDDGVTAYIEVAYLRPETDEEKTERLAKEERLVASQREWQLKRAREVFAMLKTKYANEFEALVPIHATKEDLQRQVDLLQLASLKGRLSEDPA
jgi:hypothetical protein